MQNNRGRKGCSLQASLVKWGSVTSHYSSETEKHLKHFPHSKCLHSLNSDNCFCGLQTKKNSQQPQTFQQPSFTQVTIIICLLVLAICEKWLQYWAVIYPCSVYSFWKQQQFLLLGKKKLRKSENMVRLHWLGMNVHFQTFVVACVKLKKNVARAKKLYLQF